jgi:hypothetical protein
MVVFHSAGAEVRSQQGAMPAATIRQLREYKNVDVAENTLLTTT